MGMLLARHYKQAEPVVEAKKAEPAKKTTTKKK